MATIDLPQEELLAMLAEEASELAQAALKLRRALDGTNYTPKSIDSCKKAFGEEWADVLLCMNYLLDLVNDDDVLATMTVKDRRWHKRLAERQNK